MNWPIIVRTLRRQMGSCELARAARISRATVWALQSDPAFEPRWPTCRRVLLLYARYYPQQAFDDLQAELFGQEECD